MFSKGSLVNPKYYFYCIALKNSLLDCLMFLFNLFVFYTAWQNP